MKTLFIAICILGVLMALLGGVFAFQGDGMIGGSTMSGNSFWIYAGSSISIVGLVIAILGVSLGSRGRTSEKDNPDGADRSEVDSSSASRSSLTTE